MKTPMRFWPLESRLRSKLRQRLTMDDLCISRTVICPAEVSMMPAVVMLPEQRKLVTASQSETTLDNEWKRIGGNDEARHQETVRYVFENVLATPQGFFVGGHGFNQFGHPSLGSRKSAKIHMHQNGFFGLSSISMKYFGHWLLDGLPNTLLRQPGEDLYFPVNPSWSHAQSYLDLLEIDRIRHDHVFFERMSFCVDIGQNSNRRSRTKSIQHMVRSKVKNGNRRVYISRGFTGENRLLTNEAELITALDAVGFDTVSVTSPLDDILTVCAGAEVTVSMEGSHMSHAFFASNPNSFHVTINPADRFNNIFADYMPSLDMRLGTFVAQIDGKGYRVNVPRFLDFLSDNSAIDP